MSDKPGPYIEEELRWDAAAAFSLTPDIPWDLLRAQLLWAIWCQRVEVAFRDDDFHLGAILTNAWWNTIYAAMEAYKELFRHARNEEKRQKMISCFQKVWTEVEIFGRLKNGDIKWNLIPHREFLPVDLGAWNATPIRINRSFLLWTLRQILQHAWTFPKLLTNFYRMFGIIVTIVTHNRHRAVQATHTGNLRPFRRHRISPTIH